MKRREWRQKEEEEFFGQLKKGARETTKELTSDAERKKQQRKAEREKIMVERERLLATGLDEEDLPERLRKGLDDKDDAVGEEKVFGRLDARERCDYLRLC